MSPLKEISRNKLKKAEYLCNICKEVFGEESDYKIHLQQHEQKENKCTICGQIFANKWNLKRHCENVHGLKEDIDLPQKSLVQSVKTVDLETKENKSEITAYCDICNQGFRGRCGKKNMERHRKNIHASSEAIGMSAKLTDDDSDENDETYSENEDDDVKESLTDLDIVTDFYNKIILGMNPEGF